MALLFRSIAPPKRQYLDRGQFASLEQQNLAKSKSSTVYVEGLSDLTLEEQIYELFRKCGVVSRVVMGLHRINRTPCGFCFVEYEQREAALQAEALLNLCRLDGKVLKVELDPGFKEGRQYGRARGGGQVSSERKNQIRTGFGGAGQSQNRFGNQQQQPQQQQRPQQHWASSRGQDNSWGRPRGIQGYNQGGYNQGGYNQGGFNRGGFNQGGFNRGGFNQGGFNRGGFNQGGYNRGGYNQGGYNRGGFNQGGYNQGHMNQYNQNFQNNYQRGGGGWRGRGRGRWVARQGGGYQHRDNNNNQYYNNSNKSNNGSNNDNQTETKRSREEDDNASSGEDRRRRRRRRGDSDSDSD